MRKLKVALLLVVMMMASLCLSFACSGAIEIADDTHEYTAITVTGNPTKTEYGVGETLSTEGLVISAHCSKHNTDEAISLSDVKITYEHGGSFAYGDTKVTITYAGYTAEISITVVCKNHVAGTPVRENEVAATCTTEGSYEEVVYCSVCGTEISRETKTIEKIAHTPADAVKEHEVAATCGQEGSYEEVVYCSVCGTEISRETKTTEKIAHTPAEAVKEHEEAATCTVEGSYDEVVYCSVCKAELSRETKTVAAKGHTPADAVKENIVAATCTIDGSYDEVVYCTVCEEELSRETKTVDAKGHTPADAVKENEVAAICTVEGSYDEVVYCTVCEEELSRVTVTVEAKGHTPADAVKENEVAATCTIDGSYDEVVYCTVCEEELSRATKIVAAKGHTPADAVKENEVAATCTVDGGYDEVVYCTVCEEELSRVTKIVAAKGHTPADAVKENEVAATCAEAGSYDSVVYCTVCNAEISREPVVVPIDDTAHNYVTYYNENGHYTVCSICSKETDLVAHEINVVSDGEGYKAVCECGYSYGIQSLTDSIFVEKVDGTTPNSPLTKISAEVTAANGFKEVNAYYANEKWTSYNATYHTYNKVDLSNYAEVWFAIKLANLHYRVCEDGTNAANWDTGDNAEAALDWIYFHMTQTSDSVWTIKATTADGSEYFTIEDQSGAAIAPENHMPKNSIPTILYHNLSGKYFSIRKSVLGEDTTAIIYTTEVVGALLDEFDPNVSNEAKKVTDSAMGNWSNFDCTDPNEDIGNVTAPTGYTSVSRYDAKSTFTSGVVTPNSYDKTDFSGYKEVYFALKFVNCAFQLGVNKAVNNLTAVTSVDEAKWFYFRLTQTGDSVWSILIVDEDGNLVARFTEQSGTDVANVAQSPYNSIAAITYGNGNQSADAYWVLIRNANNGNTASIYSTEVYGVEKAE